MYMSVFIYLYISIFPYVYISVSMYLYLYPCMSISIPNHLSNLALVLCKIYCEEPSCFQTGRSGIHRAGQQAGNPGKSWRRSLSDRLPATPATSVFALKAGLHPCEWGPCTSPRVLVTLTASTKYLHSDTWASADEVASAVARPGRLIKLTITEA